MMIMKRFILIVSVMLACPVLMTAGDRKDRKPDFPFKYEFRLGWCGFPALDDLNFSGYNDYVVSYYTPISDVFSDYDGPVYMTGNIMAEMNFHIERWFTLSVGLAADGMWKSFYDVHTEEKTGTSRGASVTILPQARFNWLNRDVVRMYSSVGLGVTAGRFDDSSGVFRATQLVPVGITVGRRLFGFAEIGYGTLFIGGMFGVGYRF